MPREAYTSDLIVIPVADRCVNDTRIKQKVRFLKLMHDQAEDTGECSAQIIVRVLLYAADASAPDGYGPLLSGPGLSSYTRTLVANNDTLVDPATGSILAIRDLNATQEDWENTIDSFPQTTLFQGDFFHMMRRYSPIDIEEMIIDHIRNADAMGHFAG
jgi:hypothetical protein